MDSKLQVVKRDPDYPYQVGMRAHPNLTWLMCLKSTIIPWHNEWLVIWFYLFFAVYFWVQTILIMAHSHKEYNFKYEKNFNFMFVATLSIAISLSMTAFYLTFYSISETIN